MYRLLLSVLLLSTFALQAADDPAGAAASAVPAPGTQNSPIRIWVDQIGYRTDGKKMAVVASGTALPDTLEIELRDAKTNAVVWSLKDHAAALVKFNNGQKDGDSGDFIAQLDFGDFKKDGRYYFALSAPSAVRSYFFNISPKPYRDAGLAAWKAFYYNRADGEKLEKHAGVWNHAKAYMGPNQATEAKVYKWAGGRWPDSVGKEILDEKTYDVHGAWWDAGDFNKYTSNTVKTHNMLLTVYEMVKGRPKDDELNIPESGNKFPDALDEIRFCTEFLIRDHDGTGASFGRVHMEPSSPPDAMTKPVQLTVVNSGSTIARAAGLAYAAVVWKESGLDDAFAQKCLDESMRSWELLKTKVHPWPADPKDPKKLQYTGEWFALNFNNTRAMAAACYFRLTGKKEYDEIVHQMIADKPFAKGQAFGPGELDEFYPLMWVYTHTKDADPALVENMKKSILATADNTINWTGAKRGYAMAVKGFWWGSNQLVGQTGGVLVMAAQLTDDKAKKKAYLDAAEEYVHYLYGRNPIGRNFFSNMKSFGAEASTTVMFHSWVGNESQKFSAKYIGEGEGKIGPFPGMVVGGVNGGMKRYCNELDWRKNPWEFNEPDIGYQCAVCLLLSPFTWPE